MKLVNFSISGAITNDVKEQQLPKALKYKPDIILISVGANDVTHRTSTKNIQSSLDSLLDQLIENNCNAKIILTGSADVGSVPRFLQPLRWIAGQRVKQINEKVFYPTIEKRDLTLAPIARETGPIFKKDPSLFAKDRYHPNNQGYEVWNKVIYKSIDEAIDQESHCN